MGMEIKHGTAGGYKKCVKRPERSCEECRSYNREYANERRLRAKKEFTEHPERFEHGTHYVFKLGCDCKPCKDFGNEKNKEFWTNRTNIVVPDDAHGTLRGYSYYKCRCEDCVAAKKLYRILMIAKAASRKKQD